MNSCQDEKGNHCLDCRNEKLLRTVVGKFCYIKQVIGHATHNLPDFCIIIVRIRELLQMPVSVPPHICLNLRPHHMPHICHVIAGDTVHDPQYQIKQSQPAHCLHRKRRQIPHSFIRDIAHNKRQHQFAYRRQSSTEQVHAQRSFIFFEIRHKSFQQFL